MPGSQLAWLRFFHVIAKLIFNMFHRRTEIPANRASPASRASPPHVIGPLAVREDTSSGRKCDVTFLLFLRKYAKIGKNNREKLVPIAKSSLPVSSRNIREL